jgi:SH3-like domain-containing protein
MKSFIRGISLILVFTAFIGINPSALAAGSTPQGTEKSGISEVNSCGVTLTADRQSYSTNEPNITLTFRNTTEKEYDFGLNYSLEARFGDEWYRYTTDVSWPMIGLVLGANKSMTRVIEPAKIFGLLETGEYRVVWEVYNTKTNQPFFIAAEFEIKPLSAAPPASNFQTMKVTSNTLNVRSGAGMDFEAIGLLGKNQFVELVGESAAWSHIRWYDGSKYVTGYVSSRYIKKSGPVVYYAKEQVNVRSSADAGSSIIGILDTGDPVTFLKKAGRWTLAQYNGTQAYVYGKYLTKNRKDCFLSHPVAAAIGERSIKDISYTFAPKALEGASASIVPSLEISYNVRMRSRNNSLLITVYRFDSANKALQAGSEIGETAIHPEWTRVYFLKGSDIVRFDLKGLEFTKMEMQLLEGIKAALRMQYGEPIIFI